VACRKSPRATGYGFGHGFSHGYQYVVIADNHHTQPPNYCIHAAGVLFRLFPSYFVLIGFSRSAKLRCGGSNPPGASTSFRSIFRRFY
jgi:hypothetical protein